MTTKKLMILNLRSKLSLAVCVITVAQSLIAMGTPPADGVSGRTLHSECNVGAPIDRVWRAWTTSEGIASFFSPESKIELRIGGPYELYMNMKEPDESGGRGTEGCRLLSYIPMEMLSFEWNFPPKVMNLRRAHEKTQVVLRFESRGTARTRVRFDQVGWKDGKDWDDGYVYFAEAWNHVFEQLQMKLRGQTGDDPAPPVSKSWDDGHVRVTSISQPSKRQDFEMTIPAPHKKVWEILATSEGLRQLGGKEATVELKPGGQYAFWPGANNRVLAYVPHEMLSVSGSAPPQFPNVRKGGTWGAYFFQKVDENMTKLRLCSIGWRPGEKEWDDAFDYFLKNNPIFLNHVYDTLTAAANGPLQHDAVVDAPIADVWTALTTAKGIESWMVAHGTIDLRVGGKMLTHYDPNGALGDPGTIENTILSFEPPRMLSIKATKPPEKFPFKEALKHMWTVIRLDPLSENRTQVTVTSMGFGDDDESRKMREHFDRGNAYTLRKLQERFAKPEPPKDTESASAGTSKD